MKKKDKIYDSPEYKQIREHLPEILKEMERDKGLKQYQMPEGWNEDFERIYQAEHRKERIRNRILAGACAAIILGIGAVHVGEHLELTSMVQADDIGKIHENEFEQGEYQYSTYINSDVSDGEIFEEDDEVLFKSDSLEKLNVEMKETVKVPIFLINAELDKGYVIKDATYSKAHRNLNYRIEWPEKYIYVNQQMQVDDAGSGTIDESETEKSIYVDDLKQVVDIHYSAQDDSLNCSVLYDKSILFIVSNLSINEFENIVRNIQYE